MPCYKEDDPLLPKDNRSPEILGSRPQSINYVTGEAQEEKDDDQSPNNARNSLGALILGLCIILSLSFFVLPWLDDLGSDIKPGPRTIEQRVNKILTDTPLIGKTNLSFFRLEANVPQMDIMILQY
jgi:membrane dipeptidase